MPTSPPPPAKTEPTIDTLAFFSPFMSLFTDVAKFSQTMAAEYDSDATEIDETLYDVPERAGGAVQSDKGEERGGEYEATQPYDERASMVCTPTLPEDEVQRLAGLLVASQEHLGQVQADLAACQARESDLFLGVAAAKEEAAAAKLEAAAALEDFDRLHANVFWPTNDELTWEMRENLRAVGKELADARDEHASALQHQHAEYGRALQDRQHEHYLALEREREQHASALALTREEEAAKSRAQALHHARTLD